MNIVNILLQNIIYFMKNVRLRTFFPNFALLVGEEIKKAEGKSLGSTKAKISP